MPELLTPKEVMGVLKIAHTTLWRLTKKGELRKIKISERVVRYDKQEVIDYLERKGGKTDD